MCLAASELTIKDASYFGIGQCWSLLSLGLLTHSNRPTIEFVEVKVQFKVDIQMT